MKIKSAGMCFICLLMFWLLSGCSREEAVQKEKTPTGEIVPVSVFSDAEGADYASEFSAGEEEELLEKVLEHYERPNAPGIVRTGEGSLFFYFFTYDTTARSAKLTYVSIDEEGRAQGEEKTLLPETNFAVQKLWGGLENTLIFADVNTLWSLKPETGEASPIVDLKGEYVNIDGAQIQQISCENHDAITVYLYDEAMQKSEKAVITWEDRGLLPKKEKITLGMPTKISSEQLLRYIKQFNRQSPEYCVEMVEYFSVYEQYDNYLDELTKDILRGSAPDIIETSAIPVELLADKDFFVNLEPYFRKSKTVKKDDLLTSVWEAGKYNGKVRFVMPWFTLSAPAVRKEILQERAWNLETMQALITEQSHTDMLAYMAENQKLALLEFALRANSASFYDTEKGTCNFTDGRFAALLESIQQIESKSKASVRNSEETIDDFMKGGILVYPGNFSSTEMYVRAAEAMGDSVSWVGYPSEENSYHLFSSSLLLGISATSENKEGAWAFLEFLLSKEAQNLEKQGMRYGFPARKDAFEETIAVVGRDAEGKMMETEEAVKADLREIAAHAHREPYRIYDPLYDIIWEECQAYFAGDKTVEQVTEAIENRIGLYLQE